MEEERQNLKITSILKRPPKREVGGPSSMPNSSEDGKRNKWNKVKATKWDRLARTKPSPSDRDRERSLVVAATKGVVQLFNAIKEHQTGVKVQLANAKTVRKTEQTLKSLKKDKFFDKLSRESTKNERSKRNKKSGRVKQEMGDVNDETEKTKKWTVLNSDYLTSKNASNVEEQVEDFDEEA